jgi:hypothetical protein
MEKIVKILSQEENNRQLIFDDLNYWLSKKPVERLNAVEFLRKQQYGTLPRFQRVVRIIQRRES